MISFVIMMNWKSLEKIEQLNEIDHLSKDKTVLIFKHSTRCSTSATVLDRLERNKGTMATIANYYLDLIAHRDVSNEIAHKYGVIHESPQAILIKNGQAIHVSSHLSISWDDLQKLSVIH